MKKLVVLFFLITSVVFAAEAKKSEVKVDKWGERDMVYQLPLKKYPKFLCEAELTNGKKVRFVSVKAMMQVYYHQDYFKRHKLIDADIKKMYVQDYLDGTKIPAENALYVFGSRLAGPHGDDLIPLKNETNVKLFELKFGGTKVLPFERFSKGLIRYLDM